MLNRRSLSRSNCAKRSTPLVKLLVSWILKICWERSSANSASGSEGSTRTAAPRFQTTDYADYTDYFREGSFLGAARSAPIRINSPNLPHENLRRETRILSGTDLFWIDHKSV